MKEFNHTEIKKIAQGQAAGKWQFLVNRHMAQQPGPEVELLVTQATAFLLAGRNSEAEKDSRYKKHQKELGEQGLEAAGKGWWAHE